MHNFEIYNRKCGDLLLNFYGLYSHLTRPFGNENLLTVFVLQARNSLSRAKPSQKSFCVGIFLSDINSTFFFLNLQRGSIGNYFWKTCKGRGCFHVAKDSSLVGSRVAFFPARDIPASSLICQTQSIQNFVLKMKTSCYLCHLFPAWIPQES